jgi:hypothetical protein
LGGVGKSIGFYYVDDGWDVWVGNSRGNKYCLSHLQDKIDTKEFFAFSFEEIGRYDAPAVYKVILGEKLEPWFRKIVYFGYSIGTTEIFSAMSDTGDNGEFLRKKTDAVIALAPTLYFSDWIVKNPALKKWARLRDRLWALAHKTKIYNYWTGSCNLDLSWKRLQAEMCALSKHFCGRGHNSSALEFLKFDSTLDTYQQEHGSQIENKFSTLLPEFSALLENHSKNSHLNGHSIKNIVHMLQNVDGKNKTSFNLSRCFQCKSLKPQYELELKKFDYGFMKNFIVYGQFSPPAYDYRQLPLEKIHWIVLDKDKAGSLEALQSFIKRMTKKPEADTSPLRKFNEPLMIEGWELTTPIYFKQKVLIFG